MSTQVDLFTTVEPTSVSPAIAKPMLAEVAVFNEDALLTMSERMQSDELDLILTSPPYFNARDYSQYKSVQDYLAQMKEIFTMAYDRLKMKCRTSSHHYRNTFVGCCTVRIILNCQNIKYGTLNTSKRLL